MNASDLEPDALFTTDGKDIWKLKTFCMTPTCELHNLEGDAVESFGMGGLTARRFYKIEMPKIGHSCGLPTVAGATLRDRLGG